MDFILKDLVQPKVLILLGIYLGIGLSIGSMFVSFIVSGVAAIFTPKGPSMEEIMAQMEQGKGDTEERKED